MIPFHYFQLFMDLLEPCLRQILPLAIARRVELLF